MGELKPAAFLSYVRDDEDDESRHITQFRECLSKEVRRQTGEDFPIFQDRNDIKWGENWEERIKKSLNEVTFLIPIITPSFFKSPACRNELKKFLEREKELKRKDLILSVYYIGCPLLDDEKKCKQDKLAEIIAERQYADWRELRFEPFTKPEVGKALAQLAMQIRDALGRTAAPSLTLSTPKEASGEESTPLIMGAESLAESIKAEKRPSIKTEPPIHIVDPMHRGHHTTITEAIKAASPGDRIIVRPGLYQEGLIINKPLEIIGEGRLDEVVVQAKGKNVLSFNTTMGRISNLTLKQMGEGDWYCVDITQGRLELEGCDTTSQSLACVAIHGGADPRLRRNRIHDGKQGGVFVYENGQGVLEDNDIFDNTRCGVGISEGGNPTLRRNRIHDCKQGGVFVYKNGQGVLEDNDIFSNAFSGVEIKTGGNPTLRRNRIHDCKQSGVYVQENGRGVLEDNDIFGNAFSGVAIKTGGNPTLRRNRIHDCKQNGVLVWKNGQGVLEDNDIFGNTLSGVEIREGGNPTLRRNRINKNGYAAVFVHDEGAGTIEDNDLRDNTQGAWDISEDSKAKVTLARNEE